MSTIINATTTNGVVIQPDNSGSLVLQTNNGTAALTISTAQDTTLAGKLTTASSGIQFSDASTQTAAASPYVLKNRIINGDMRIDQRNAGASVSYSFTTAYSTDRWRVRTDSDGVVSAQQVSDAPSSFVNSLKITVTTADSSLGASQSYFLSQLIEGNNIADLDWGLSTAKTVTLSFWVKSSVTGTFGGSLENSAENRAYPFTYAISSANTWEQKTITITGDTTGTWLTTNGVGIRVNFGWGVGSTLSGTANTWAAADYRSATGATNLMATNGATWYITGVQLEVGSTATPFERRMYSNELVNCQRYYFKDKPSNNYASLCMGSSYSATAAQMVYPYKVTMRSQPTLAVSGVTIQSATTTSNNISSLAGSYVGYDSALLEITTSGFTARNACWMNVGANGSTAYVEGSAEL